MASVDLIQKFGRKLKRPHIRRWFHSKTGDDTFTQIPATKKALIRAFIKNRDSKQDIVVAHRGKEFGVAEFLRKNPKFRRKKNLKGGKK